MIKEIKLPQISENVDSGEVIEVLVSEGDIIKLDQSVAELETEKASFEVPSTAEGKVTEVLVKQGQKIKVGDTIVKVDTESTEQAKPKAEQKSPPEKEKQPEKEIEEESPKTSGFKI